MKNAQKIQFVLTPIFICILSIMLVVVSFSWYKVSANTDIKTESSEVSIKAEAPKGVEVTITLTPIGDDYQVTTDASNNSTYSLIMKPSATDSNVGVLNGYYGQTGLKEYPDLDKVYIAFYKAVVSSNAQSIDINSAYIQKSVVTKTEENGTISINKEVTAEGEASSPYQVRFYDGTVEEVSVETGGSETSSSEATVAETSSAETNVTSTNKKYTFSNESDKFSFTGATDKGNGQYEKTIYVGVKFIASVNSTTTSNTDGSFLYSNISYFGSKFTLTASFINTPEN